MADLANEGKHSVIAMGNLTLFTVNSFLFGLSKRCRRYDAAY